MATTELDETLCTSARIGTDAMTRTRIRLPGEPGAGSRGYRASMCRESLPALGRRFQDATTGHVALGSHAGMDGTPPPHRPTRLRYSLTALGDSALPDRLGRRPPAAVAPRRSGRRRAPCGKPGGIEPDGSHVGGWGVVEGCELTRVSVSADHFRVHPKPETPCPTNHRQRIAECPQRRRLERRAHEAGINHHAPGSSGITTNREGTGPWTS
jgi:hypothetical protein